MAERYIEVEAGDRVIIYAVPKASPEAPPKPPEAMEDLVLLGTLEGCEIYVSQGRVEWLANMTVCCDGSGGNPDNDPYFQSQTAYYNKGKYLNPYKVPYIVVPPLIINGVGPIVLGCQGEIHNVKNGKMTLAVVGDVGPSTKIGEASVEAAKRVGLSGDPNSGGTDDLIIQYYIFPGIPAQVDGITYALQAS
jgi:hypothetical protein